MQANLPSQMLKIRYLEGHIAMISAANYRSPSGLVAAVYRPVGSSLPLASPTDHVCQGSRARGI